MTRLVDDIDWSLFPDGYKEVKVLYPFCYNIYSGTRISNDIHHAPLDSIVSSLKNTLASVSIKISSAVFCSS